MRGRLALLAAGAAAAVGIAHRLRGRRRASTVPTPVPPPEPAHDPRAEALRDKLAASREVVDERDADEERETPVDEAVDVAAAEADVEARRDEIHARGKAAVAEMQADGAPPREP